MTERQHTPYHERHLDQQILDALLRIEELLTPETPAVAKGEAVMTVEPVKKKRFGK